MMVEIGIGVLLAAVGFAVLAPLHRDLGGWAQLWLALPVGAAVYLMVALLGLAMAATLDPDLALLVTTGVGIVGAALAIRTGAWDGKLLGWAVATAVLAAITVLVARTYHLTRLTPDSLRYLLFSSDIRLPDALHEIHRSDLITRQMGLPSLHALSALSDRRYLASIGPLFGVSGLGFFIWLTWRSTRRVATHRRLSLVTAAVIFLGTSNRLVYDVFYINTHIEVAVYLLIAISGSWLAVTTRNSSWALPAGLALAATLLFRAEAPIVAGIVLVALGACRTGWPTRLVMVTPTLFVSALWYGVILWRFAPDGDAISLMAPVFGSLIVVLGGTSLVLAGGVKRLSPLIRHADWVMLAAILATLAVMSVRDVDILVRSVEATVANLTGSGLWLLTWPAAIVLLTVALMVHGVPAGRVWTTSIVGFGLLFWLLPFVREGAWRIGAGDSGNRILAHILSVLVAFLVLATIDSWPTEITDVDGDRRAGAEGSMTTT